MWRPRDVRTGGASGPGGRPDKRGLSPGVVPRRRWPARGVQTTPRIPRRTGRRTPTPPGDDDVASEPVCGADARHRRRRRRTSLGSKERERANIFPENPPWHLVHQTSHLAARGIVEPLLSLTIVSPEEEERREQITKPVRVIVLLSLRSSIAKCTKKINRSFYSCVLLHAPCIRLL